MAGILEMMGHIQSEGERGKQAGLSRLIGKAYNDPSQRQAALGRVAQFDGPAAFNAQAMFEKMDDNGRKRLGQRMAVFSALPDDIKAQAYPDIAREAQALGIPAPGEWNPEFAPHMQKIAQALTTGMQEMPTGFRQFQMTAEAAGLQPGTPEYQQAANIALGREGRASNAGFGFELTEGMDGRKRLQRRNPRSGAVEVYDESTGDFVPVGGMGGGMQAQGQPPMQAPVNVPSGLVRTASGEMVRLDPNMPAADREAIIGGRVNENGSFQGAPMIQQRTANPNLVVGRRPEDEALATETAKQSVQTGFLPQQEAIKTQAAIQQAGGVEQAKAGIERATVARTKAPQLQNVERGLKRIGSAMQALEGGMVNTGPLDKYAMQFSEKGQELEAAVGAIKNDMLALTRVPGVGSQSDLEQRIGDLKYPAIGNHPEVNRRNLAQLNAFLRDLEEAVGSAGQRAAPASGDVDDLLSKYGIR